MSRFRHHRPAKLRPRHFQFSIGRLLVLMTVCALVFAVAENPLLKPPVVMIVFMLLFVVLFADWSARHVAAGTEALKTGKYRVAVERFSQAIEDDPEDPERYCYRASALSWCDDAQAALEDYSRAIALDSRCQPAWSGRATVALGRGLYRQAIDDATVALCLDSDDYDALQVRAQAQTVLGPLAGAAEDLSAALRLNPRGVEPLGARGYVHMLIGEYVSALADFAAAARLGEGTADLYAAFVRFKMGDHWAAIVAIERFRNFHPTWADGLNAHSWFLATCPDDSLRDGTLALKLAEEASRLRRDGDWSCDDYLAAALAEVGRFDEAIQHAEKSLVEAPPVWRPASQAQLATYRAGQPLRDHGDRLIDPELSVLDWKPDEAAAHRDE
jgi:tetratricopeptide (TPR) repeat protein